MAVEGTKMAVSGTGRKRALRKVTGKVKANHIRSWHIDKREVPKHKHFMSHELRTFIFFKQFNNTI
ncbi:hypothetical protein [Litoribacterium kuwaitense]|uniref:hypothetical protein n=1 Tax=Litoribacterium kuwaitense TaxID=1398745 RepID=UPI001FEB9182|nr:hypothetical protein [Litoribacterium kuwaitense]